MSDQYPKSYKYKLEDPTWDISFKEQFDITLSAFEDADREFLVKYAQKYLALEYRTTQVESILDKGRRIDINRYLQREGMTECVEFRSLVEEFEYTLMQTRYLSELIRLDSIVMKQLKMSEPAVYRKVIEARQENSHFSQAKNLGVYNSKGFV